MNAKILINGAAEIWHSKLLALHVQERPQPGACRFRDAHVAVWLLLTCRAPHRTRERKPRALAGRPAAACMQSVAKRDHGRGGLRASQPGHARPPPHPAASLAALQQRPVGCLLQSWARRKGSAFQRAVSSRHRCSPRRAVPPCITSGVSMHWQATRHNTPRATPCAVTSGRKCVTTAAVLSEIIHLRRCGGNRPISVGRRAANAHRTVA